MFKKYVICKIKGFNTIIKSIKTYIFLFLYIIIILVTLKYRFNMNKYHICFIAEMVCKFSCGLVYVARCGLQCTPLLQCFLPAVVSPVCGTVALLLSGWLSAAAAVQSNLIPETSGPDETANEAFPSAPIRPKDIHLLPAPSVSTGAKDPGPTERLRSALVTCGGFYLDFFFFF